MITIQTDRQSFAYDIHSLVKAFYPEQEVHVKQDAETPDEGTDSLKLVVSFVTAENITPGNATPRNGAARNEAAGSEVAGNGATEHEDAGKEAAENVPTGNVTPENATPRNGTARNETAGNESAGCTICAEFSSQGTVLRRGQTEVPPGTDRREVKNELKRLLYRMLREQTGKTLPWGTLTGIRPTKIPMRLLDEGWKNAQIAQYLRDTYYTSNEKTALAIAIANRERHILRDLNFENGYSLYVGIPFCPSICLYCSFSSSPLHLWKDQVDAYLDALCREIDYASEAFSGRELNTVYIGGGTPTTLEPRQMDRLLTKLEQSFRFDRLREFTVEAGRPDSITREKLQVLKDRGISRISINPQTMNQKTLDFIGRKHTVEETVAAFELAREMGFDNINMDLIVGLPGEGKEEVEHTMQELGKLDPDCVTVHSLAVKRASRLRLFLMEDKLQSAPGPDVSRERGSDDGPDPVKQTGMCGSGGGVDSAGKTDMSGEHGSDDGSDSAGKIGMHRELTMTNSQEIMEMTARYAQQAGMFPYYLYRQKNMAGNFENVGYAKEGKEGIYNILIMEELQSILALGAGAATKLVFEKDRIERIENVKDIRNYIDRIDEMIERKRIGLHE